MAVGTGPAPETVPADWVLIPINRFNAKVAAAASNNFSLMALALHLTYVSLRHHV